MVRPVTIKEIATRVKRQKDNRYGSTAVLIGAGCSVSSGIPACPGMMKDIEVGYADLIANCSDKTYASYMDCLSPNDRKEFLDNYIKKAKLNISHIFLASLVRNGYVDCILTTNFDTLALKALTTLNIFPAVYDLASSSGYISGAFNFPAIIYLHGQYTGFWQMNTSEEMQSVKQSIKQAFDEIIAHRTLIMIGYGGNDPVLDVLGDRIRFNDLAYWVGYKEKAPQKHIEDKLFNDSKKSVYFLPEYDADKFFFNLHNELALNSPLLFSEPFRHLEETYELVSKELKMDDKPFDLTGNARGKIKQAEDCVAIRIDKKLTPKKDSGKKKPTKDLATRALDSWMAWMKNEPDALYEEVLKSSDDTAKENLSYAYVEKGNSFFNEKNHKQALECYSRSVSLKPDYAIAYYNRGATHQELKDSVKAIADCTKAIELKADYADAYFNRGNAYHSLKDSVKAIADYTKAIELKADYADAYVNRGTGYDSLKDYDLAIADYTKAIKLQPDDALAYSNRGAAYNSLKDHDKAITDCTTAIELQPDNANAYINRGNAYDSLKDYDHAIADYTKAIKLHPDDPDAYINRSSSYRHKGFYEQALADIHKAFDLHPEFGYAYSSLAEVHAVMGNKKEFYENITKALEKGAPVWEFLDDPAYDTFKNEPEFIALINKYKKDKK